MWQFKWWKKKNFHVITAHLEVWKESCTHISLFFSFAFFFSLMTTIHRVSSLRFSIFHCCNVISERMCTACLSSANGYCRLLLSRILASTASECVHYSKCSTSVFLPFLLIYYNYLWNHRVSLFFSSEGEDKLLFKMYFLKFWKKSFQDELTFCY